MAAKIKLPNPLHGMHTAGIFSDMSIDGPEIGTLVLIVDRAKNLPNRKTIGKQDPYCAARLGKEAKKTTTDIRGGQTPKWDQELRFTVHESPDYYQLKLSVFNDDKRTELIGETWIDLRDIIVQGGGQSDQWHTLNCRGKYAGEIRIEITYYDNRPRPEKPVGKGKPMASSSETDLPSLGPRPLVKRRPLPSDPTGQAPVQAPVQAPEPVNTPPRAHPNPPSSIIPNPASGHEAEYSTPPPNRHPHADLYSPAHAPGYQHGTPPQHRDYNLPRGTEREVAYGYSSAADPFHQRESTPPRTHEIDSRAAYNPRTSYATQSAMVQPRRSLENSERPPPPPAHRVRKSGGHSADAMHRSSYEMVHKATPPMRHDVLRNEAQRHPLSSAPSPAYPGRPTYRPYESAPALQDTPPRHDTDRDHGFGPRHHSYDSAYDSHHRPMQPTVEDVPESWTPPQTISRSSTYEEPVMNLASKSTSNLASGSAPFSYSGHGSTPQHEQYVSSQLQSQAHSDNSFPHEQYSSSAPHSHGHYETGVSHEPHGSGQLVAQPRYNNYNQNESPPPVSPMDYSQALTHVPRGGQVYQESRYMDPRDNPDNHMSDTYDYGPPAVPTTLVPGVDPTMASMALELAKRPRHERKERRYTQPGQMVVHPRGRQHSEPPAHYPVDYPPHGQPPSSREYDRTMVAYSGGPSTPSAPPQSSDYRRTSPNPPGVTHTIKRKSVSPAPPVSSEPRRSSGVPFGPDSYDAFNPTISASREEKPGSADYTNANGKIITADGREIDPSDHLPMDTWAPEPEPKKPSQPVETRSRPVPSGAQPMPPSGRRQPRTAARPQSMAVTPPMYAGHEPPAPSSSSRNRFQKKPHRVSALPAPVSSVGSSPLGPATAHQRNSTPPRALVRASTFDYENHGHVSDSDYGAPRMGHGTGPPIPAKVPMMSGALNPLPSTGRGVEEMSLMEEMSRIDIGTGRARRHARY
ncbi:hypothetical protein GGS20DRAFT_533021 [Poronia punctata]|nr:hypothetical protein GGS20DRAFT_533021 [Poronia punctata]